MITIVTSQSVNQPLSRKHLQCIIDAVFVVAPVLLLFLLLLFFFCCNC